MPFWLLLCESEAVLFKKFRPGHRAGVFIWENFLPGYRDLGRKNRDLGNRASPASHTYIYTYIHTLFGVLYIVHRQPSK